MQRLPAHVQAAVNRLNVANDYEDTITNDTKEMLRNYTRAIPYNLNQTLVPHEPKPAVVAREAAYMALPNTLVQQALRSRHLHVTGRKRPRVTVDNVDPETGIASGSELGRYTQELRKLRGKDFQDHRDQTEAQSPFGGKRLGERQNVRGTMDSP